MGDILAEIGLRIPEWLRQQITCWLALFATHRPDLVVADYAPGAVLAARGRIPSVAAGVGFTVPPAHLRELPPLHRRAAALHAEDRTLATVNSVVSEFGLSPLRSLVESLAGDAQCVCTLPALDPYAAWREEPVLGPLLGATIVRRSADAKDVFCYLREPPGSDRQAEIAACLEALPSPVTAFLPGLDASTGERLRRGGVNVADRPVDLARQLARSRLVVHFGGHGTAAAALLAGVPQLILAFDIEKALIASALEGQGAARGFDYRRVDSATARTSILAALEDKQQLAKADELASRNDAYRYRDVASRVADVCANLLS
jgi:UDP:flavonoid glycosyltransferase YjiC (YdhE family)